MTITIMPAESRHAESIARFNQMMAEETEDKELPWEKIHPGVQAMLEDSSKGFYLVAVDDDSAATVACLGVTFEWSDWRNGLFWWVQSVYVDNAWRGKGVFSEMYKKVKSMARDNPDICGIRLYVERDNDRAYNTYRKLGMIETEYRLMEEDWS